MLCGILCDGSHDNHHAAMGEVKPCKGLEAGGTRVGTPISWSWEFTRLEELLMRPSFGFLAATFKGPKQDLCVKD